MLTNVILVNGKKRHGKDYFSEKLKEHLEDYGHSVEIMHLAGPLKDIIAETFGCTLEELDEFKNEKTPIKVNRKKMTDFRLVLQRFGTEAMKKWFGNAVWVNLLEERAKLSDADYIIVPDFRFKIESIDGITVRVRNNDIISHDTHASETELDDYDFDYEVNNTGKPDLSDQVEDFYRTQLKDSLMFSAGESFHQ